MGRAILATLRSGSEASRVVVLSGFVGDTLFLRVESLPGAGPLSRGHG
jgi:hypothetical protein